jgi:hypothetical protein
VGLNWLGVAELIVALIGVILAAYFYQKSKHIIRISYFIEQIQLLGRSPVLPDDVSIIYRGEAIPNVVKSNIIFWNSGNVPIRHDDIVPSSPITITPASATNIIKPLIKAHISRSCRENGVLIRAMSTSSLMIDFVYLDPQQGFNLELLYSGDISSPQISGAVIGMTGGFTKFRLESSEKTITFAGLCTMLASGILPVSLYTIITHYCCIDEYKVTGVRYLAIGAVIFLLGNLGGIFSSSIVMRVLRRNRFPDSLKT